MAVDGSRRVRPGLSLMGPADVERVHEASLDLLERVGIALLYPPGRDMLRAHGAGVDEASGVTRIPRAVIAEALASAPRSFTMSSQADPARDCPLGWGEGQYARPVTGLNWILDARATRRRAVTRADVVDWVRVTHALPTMRLAASAYDQDGDPRSMDVRAVATMLAYTDKPLLVSALGGEGIRWARRLAEVTQAPDRQPRILILSSVNSPLFYDHGQMEAAMVAAEVGVAVQCGSSAVSGVTAPTTLAGALVQMNAEALAAITVIQLHRPGAPVIYFGHPMAMDMRTGTATMGFAESGLVAAALADMGRFYGLPTSTVNLATDVCVPDALAVSEKTAAAFLPTLSGAQLCGGAGALACTSTISLEQLVIDDDVYARIFRQVGGFGIDDETLAGDLIADVGVGGSYVAEEHTVAHFRSEHWYSPLADGLVSGAWEAAGSKDVVERAHERVRAILDAPAEPVVSSEQQREIGDVLARAEAALQRA